jgi:hypothetical protein
MMVRMRHRDLEKEYGCSEESQDPVDARQAAFA